MKENEWTTEEKLIGRQFKKLYEEDPTQAPAVDLTFMADAARTISKKRRYSNLGKIAAVLMLMAASSLVTAVCISNGYVDAFKDTIDKKLFKMNTSVLITEDDISGEETEIWEISDYELVPKLQEIFDEIKIPSYLPRDYTFESALIEQYIDENYVATFSFKAEKNELLIIEMPVAEGSDLDTASNGEIIELADRTIYMWDDPLIEVNGATVIFEDAMIQVSSESLSLDEIRNIAVGLD